MLLFFNSCHVQLFCDLMDCRLSMGFSRQEYWSGLQFPSSGDLTDVGINPVSPALAGGFFTTEPPGKLHYKGYQIIKLQLLHSKSLQYLREGATNSSQNAQTSLGSGCTENKIQNIIWPLLSSLCILKTFSIINLMQFQSQSPRRINL